RLVDRSFSVCPENGDCDRRCLLRGWCDRRDAGAGQPPWGNASRRRSECWESTVALPRLLASAGRARYLDAARADIPGLPWGTVVGLLVPGRGARWWWIHCAAHFQRTR